MWKTNNAELFVKFNLFNVLMIIINETDLIFFFYQEKMCCFTKKKTDLIQK